MADDQGYSFDDVMGPQQSAPPDVQPSAPPPDSAPAAHPEGGLSFDEVMNSRPERTWGEELGRDVRTFARGVLPTTAGVIGGTLAAAPGAAVGSALGPAGTIAGGVASGVAGGFAAGAAAQVAQDKITDALGIDSPENRAADAADPNLGSRVAEFAPAAVSLGTGGLGATLARRALSGAAMGAIDIGQQVATKGEIDPTEAAVAAGTGALFTKPRGFVPGEGKLPNVFGDQGSAPEGEPAPTDRPPDAAPPGEGQPVNENAPKATPEEHQVYHSADSGSMPANTLGTAVSQAQPDGIHEQYTGGVAPKAGEFSAGTGDIGRDQGKRSLNAPEGVVGADDNPGVQMVEPGMPGPALKAALGVSPEIGDRDLLTGKPDDQPQTPRPQALMPRPPIGADQPFSPADTTMKYQWPGEKARVRVPAGSREVPAAGEQTAPPAGETQKTPTENDDIAARVLQEIEADPHAHNEFLDGPQEQPNGVTEPPRAQFGQRPQSMTEMLYNGGERPGEIIRPEQGADLLRKIEADPNAHIEELDGPKPKPQSVGAAALGDKDFGSAEPPAAGRMSRVSKLGDVLKNFGPNWVKQAFTPELVNKDTRAADTAIREGQGLTNREQSQLNHNTKELERAINRAPADQREQYVDTFQRGVPNTNELAKLAPGSLAAERSFQDRIRGEDPNGAWHSNFLPKMFADEEGARNFSTDWREEHADPPTIGDFRQNGFALKDKFNRQDGSVDPMKVKTELYGGMSRFLEGKRITDKMVDDGTIYEHQGPGLEKLDNLSAGNRSYYATPEVKTVLDRYFDPGSQDVTSKSFLNAAQKVKNTTTALQLIGGGYHLVAETQEAFIGDLMRAVSHVAAGDVGKAGKILAGSPLAPLRAYKAGSQILKGYLDPSKVDPAMGKAIDYMTKAGLTAERVQRYTPESGTVRGFFEAANKAALKLELGEHAQTMKNFAKNPKEAAMTPFRVAGQAMQSIMEPLFNQYIPQLKMGVAYQQFADYLAANPGKSEQHYTEIAKRVLKSVDDRLGEMNQSTLYWNNTIKRAANLAMISPGWETGTIRAALGGGYKMLTNPKSMSIKSDDFHPNAAWPIAFALGTAFVNSTYQFLKTGKPPEEPTDAFFPKTGGKDQHGNAQRAILPGYEKDVYGWWDAATNNKGLTRNASSMAYNKLAAAPRAVWDTLANKDWAGKQIYNPDDPLHKKMADYFHYLQTSFAPIMAKQLKGDQNPKSAISTAESGVGIRQAPSSIQNPGAAVGTAKANKKEAEEAARFRKKYPQ